MKKGALLLYILIGTIVLILVAELVEILVYGLTGTYDIFASISDATLFNAVKFIPVCTFPIFAIIIVFGIDEINDKDRKILISSSAFFIFVRVVILNLVFKYDYANITVDNYFSFNFYANFLWSVASFVVIIAALYYVIDYKLDLSKQWLIFCSMIVFTQLARFAHYVVLAHLFSKNVIVTGEIYKVIMLTPPFLLQCLSGFLFLSDNMGKLVDGLAE